MMTTVHIKRVAKVTTGSTPPTNEPRFYETEDVDWFTPGDMDEQNIFCRAEKRIADTFFSETGCQKMPSGSVLMVGIGATVGKVGYSDHECYANQQINAISFNHHKVLPKYGAYWLLSKKEEINKITPTVTLPIFNQSKVKMLMISYPNVSVQQKMVDYLDEKTSVIDTQVELLEKKKDAYTRLKKAMINRAVTRGLDEHVKLKDSGVEWIGMIPEHWEVKRFKVVAKTIKGKQCEYFDEKEKNMEVVLTVETLRQDTPAFFNYGIVEDKSQLCDENDMVVIWDGAGVGEFLKAKKGILSSTIAKIDVDEKKVLKPYLWQWRYQIEYRLKSVPTGMGIPHLNPTLLNNYAIPVPPLSEQQIIATCLNEKCTKIDAAIANIDKQMDALKRLKRSLINEVISGKRMIE